MRNLADKAINIKGKQYVLVSDRVLAFNESYPNGSIRTQKLESTDRVEFKAIVIPDIKNSDRYFTGHSQAVWGDGYINKSSALENAETSAVGRALALMGIGVLDSIASADEIHKAELPIQNRTVNKTLNSAANDKKTIVTLALKIDPDVDYKNLIQFSKFIELKTGLKLEPINYPEIIERLDVVVGEMLPF